MGDDMISFLYFVYSQQSAAAAAAAASAAAAAAAKRRKEQAMLSTMISSMVAFAVVSPCFIDCKTQWIFPLTQL